MLRNVAGVDLGCFGVLCLIRGWDTSPHSPRARFKPCVSKPEIFAQYFYLGVNLIGAHGDEIVGLSVRNLYIGLYSNGICWGMLNENGALDT